MGSRERGRNSTQLRGELASRTLAMPADCNPRGDIFGGWIMALMDSAGKMSATPHAGGRVVTVSVSNITFLQPVHVGDTVCCYTEVTRTGRTSITLEVEVWVLRQGARRAGQGDRSRVHLCRGRRGWPPPRTGEPYRVAAGVGSLPEYAAGFKQFGNNFAVPALFLHSFPSWFVGVAFAAIGIGALVPAAIMSIAA